MSLNLLNNPDDYQLHILDWDQIISNISILTQLEPSIETLNAPISRKTADEIEYRFDALDYVLKMAKEKRDGISNILATIPPANSNFEILFRLQKSHIATIKELNFVCLLIEQYEPLKKLFSNWNLFNQFSIEGHTLGKIKHGFVKHFRVFVDKQGTIHYEKHPELSALFTKVKNIEKFLRTEISNIARTDLYAKALQYSDHDVINDRFVLAVRSDSYSNKQGAIIAKSKTGFTLFVEPHSLREKANERLRLIAEIEETVSRITTNFCYFLQQFNVDLFCIQNMILEIDIVKAKAEYCEALNLIRPQLTNSSMIDLRDLFHPLLTDPVKNDIYIDSSKRGFILSGPNTGGKTVTLKAVALCNLFIHFGLFLPISSGTITPTNGIFYFSTDQQNLIEGLSSFASETENYLSLLQELSDQNIILIDEIFNSTSSEEASALAIAFLDEIHKVSDSKVIISTHHQVLKTFIHANDQYISAHVGFDEENSHPTYKIHTGHPGSSLAFKIFDIIAKKLSFPNQIADKAKDILGEKHISYERLLQELSIKKTKLEKQILQNNQLTSQLSNQKKSMDGLLRLEKEKLLKRYENKISNLLADAQVILKETKTGAISTVKQLNKRQAVVQSQLSKAQGEFTERKATVEVPQDIPTASQLKSGAQYFSTITNSKVQVIKYDMRKKEVQIIHKNVRLNCPIDSLRVVPETFKKSAPKKDVRINIEKTVVGKIELDGRGMRLPDFMSMVEKSIQELIDGDIPILSVIHGHGNGVLKKWLRDYVEKHDCLSWSAEEGNDGCTKIVLI